MIELELKPFTNEFGQVIQPNDQIIAITESYKSVHIKKGVYLGMRFGGVVVEVPCRRFVWDDNTYKNYHYEESTRRSYLQQNRIYPMSAPLSDLAGKSL